MRFIGNWPFEPSLAVSVDETRNLAFAGSGGGVYILDVSDLSNPIKISEKIHTRGYVCAFFYDPLTQRFFIADGPGGIEIWDVSIPRMPQKISSHLNNCANVQIRFSEEVIISAKTLQAWRMKLNFEKDEVIIDFVRNSMKYRV